MYRKLFKPRHKKLFDFIHARTDAKIFFHSCGAIRPGHPRSDRHRHRHPQPRAGEREGHGFGGAEEGVRQGPHVLGRRRGRAGRLRHRHAAQVRDDVKRRIDDLAPGGGFIFATVHNTQANVPPENFVAMWETLQEYGVYQVREQGAIEYDRATEKNSSRWSFRAKRLKLQRWSNRPCRPRWLPR